MMIFVRAFKSAWMGIGQQKIIIRSVEKGLSKKRFHFCYFRAFFQPFQIKIRYLYQSMGKSENQLLLMQFLPFQKHYINIQHKLYVCIMNLGKSKLLTLLAPFISESCSPRLSILTLPAGPCISESWIKIKIKLNFFLHIFVVPQKVLRRPLRPFNYFSSSGIGTGRVKVNFFFVQNELK